MDEATIPASASLRRALLMALGGACVALVVFLVGRALQQKDSRAPTSGPTRAPDEQHATFRNTDPSVDYIGSEACKECHQSEHEAYHATPHARSFGRADPASAALSGTFHHDAAALDYWLGVDDGQLRMRETVTLAPGETEVLSDHAILYTIGAGVRARAFGTALDGFLVQAPMAWYASEKGWTPPEGFELGSHPGFALPLGDGCLGCHAGRLELDGRSVNRARILEHAVGCENCHGPGALHAEYQRGPTAPPPGSDEPDDTIASLRHMSRTQQMDVCAQCHMDPYMTVVHLGKTQQDWRPGMPWSAVQTTYRPGPDFIALHEFGGHVDQLRASRCFQESTTLTCITCHGGHQGQTAEASRIATNDACRTCHDACARQPEEGQPAIPAAASDDCARCHMPRREVAELHLAATRHDIGVHAEGPAQPKPLPKEGLATLVPLQPASHLSAGEQERNLAMAFLLAAARTPFPGMQRAYASAGKLALEAARTKGHEDAEQMAALGFSAAARRMGPKAVEKLTLALEMDEKTPSLLASTRVEILGRLADHAISVRELKRARKYADRLLELRRHPDDHLRSANLYLLEEEPEKAAAAARQAIAVQPNQPGVLFQAGRILGGLGFSDEKERCDRIGAFLHNKQINFPGK
jgi:hypothetical protein